MVDTTKPMQLFLAGEWLDVMQHMFLKTANGVKRIAVTCVIAGDELIATYDIDSAILRNKPIIKKCRIASFNCGQLLIATDRFNVEHYESIEGFDRWISEWIEYEV